MKIEKLNEQYEVFTLDNGLTVYNYYNPEFTSMYANYTLNFGSLDTKYTYLGEEFDDPKGIAHYLEHLMFADGEKDYFDYYSELGANSNAYTSFSQTSYLFSAGSNYQANLKLLIEMVQSLKIDQGRVEAEYGVIKEEIEMYNSKPNFVLQNMLFSNSCTSNYKHDIAGSLESISEITYEHIKRLFDIFYSPSNATLFIASNEHITKEELEKFQVITDLHPLPVLSREDEKLEVNSSYNLEKSNVASNTQTMISYKLPVAKEQLEFIKYDIAYEILTVWLTSDLNPSYIEAIDKEQLNETFSGYHMLDKTINMLVFKITSGDYKAVTKYINNQINTIDLEIIDIIKKKKIGSEIRLFNSPEHICEFGLDFVMRNISMNTYFDVLYSISSEEILEVMDKTFKQAVSSTQILEKKEVDK